MDTSSHASLVAKWTESLKPAEVRLRLATESDSEFILRLRTDCVLAKYLSPTVADLERQKTWMRDYAKRHIAGLENYFVIECAGVSVGTIRMYDLNLKERTFASGSWIIGRTTHPKCAIRSIMLLYDLAFLELGFSAARFDVRRDNATVLFFHRRMGAEEIGKDEKNFYFKLTSTKYVSCARKRLEEFHDKVS